MRIKAFIEEVKPVNISIRSALYGICKELIGVNLGYDETFYEVLEANHKENKTGKEALYRYYDQSYHGAPWYKYELVSDDDEVIAVYKAIMTLIKYDKKKISSKGIV